MGSNQTRNLWLSIVAGVFATFLLYSYSQEKKAEYDKKYGATKRVIIAKEDIGELQTIYDTMLEIQEIPSTFVQPDAISVPEEVVGNIAAVPIKKGQVVARNYLLTPGPDTGIASQVAPSKRAVTLPIDEVRAVAKLIRPGDRVDILAAVDVGKGVSQRREVQVLMQDVVVIATGVNVVNTIPRMFELDSSGKNLTQIALTGDTKYSTITVEASLKEAQDLVYILSTSPGNLYLTLRNPNDRLLQPRLPSSTAETVLGKPVAESLLGNSGAPVVIPPQFTAPVRPSPTSAPAARPQPNNRPRPNGFQTL